MNPSESAQETARQRRFAAELSASFGEQMPASLPTRILDQFRTAPQQPRRASRSAVWLAAAALVLGVVVVASVKQARDEADQHAASMPAAASESASKPVVQDPKLQDAKLAKLTTASVYVETAELPEPGEAVERLLAIAKADRINIVIAEAVRGISNIDLTGCNGREAVQRIAAELKVPCSEYPGVLVLGGSGRSGQIGQRLTLQCEPVSVRDFVKQVHAKIGINFVVADDTAGWVQCDVEGAPWRSVIDAMCNELQLELVGHGSVLALRRRTTTAKLQGVVFQFVNTPFPKVIDVWARLGGHKFVIAKEVTGNLSLWANLIDERGMAMAIAAAVQAEFSTEDGIMRLQPAMPTTTTDLTMERAPVRQALDLAAAAVAIKSDATVSVFVRGACRQHLIDAIYSAAYVGSVNSSAVKQAEPREQQPTASDGK